MSATRRPFGNARQGAVDGNVSRTDAVSAPRPDVAMPMPPSSSGSAARPCLESTSPQVPPLPPESGCLSSLDPQAAGLSLAGIKTAMQADLRACLLSRAQVADALGVTEFQINDWCAPTKPHRIPSELIDAWARTTRSGRLPEMIARASGLGPLLDIGRATLDLRMARRRRAQALARAEKVA